jgi:trans-aconitate 2-methyltransferase
MDTQKLQTFYDEFVPAQKESGVNDRIYLLYQRCLRWGLQKNSDVLELGCGIGAFSFLLSKKITAGSVEAVDISPASIAFAQQRIRKPNFRFVAADIVHYKPQLSAYHFITLFDVLEHVPLPQHEALLKNVAAHCDNRTQILINLPNPGYVEYDRLHQPDQLQVIDQPVYLDHLVFLFQQNGLRLRHFETWSVWVQDDYHFLVLEKEKPFEEIFLGKQRNILQKAATKLWRMWLRWRYNYR